MPFIIAATGNMHKVQEYRKLLANQDVEIKSLCDYPTMPPIEENGKTFRENAGIKALAACKYCDAPAFADDSGLEVESLGGAPGIYSARYAPTDAERIAKLLHALKGQSNRRARFVCAIAIAFNGEVIETFEGICNGVIVDAPRGNGGFGYDPVFQPDGFDRTYAELTADEKNRISHRAKAYAKALEFIEDQLSLFDGGF